MRSTFDFSAYGSAGEPHRVVVSDPCLVVAGFTGRSPEVVEHHLAELQALGAPRPANVPSLYALPNWLLHADATTVQVAGEETSGEVEPVLVRLVDGAIYLTVGSDHTDRAIERTSYGASKLACPKLVSSTLWPLADVESRWDELSLESFVAGEETPYQSASLAAMTEPDALLAEVDRRLDTAGRPLVLFMGTVPLLRGTFRYTKSFTAQLHDGDRSLRCSYQVEAIDALDASPGDVVPDSYAAAADARQDSIH